MSTLVAPRDRLVTLPEGLPELTLGWEAIHWASKYLLPQAARRAGRREPVGVHGIASAIHTLVVCANARGALDVLSRSAPVPKRCREVSVCRGVGDDRATRACPLLAMGLRRAGRRRWESGVDAARTDWRNVT